MLERRFRDGKMRRAEKVMKKIEGAEFKVVKGYPKDSVVVCLDYDSNKEFDKTYPDNFLDKCSFCGSRIWSSGDVKKAKVKKMCGKCFLKLKDVDKIHMTEKGVKTVTRELVKAMAHKLLYAG